MRDILNQFVNDKIGHFIEVSNSGQKTDQSILWQCMDLAYDFLTALRIPKSTIQNQYAYQAYTNPKEITFEYFDLIPNTSEAIPQDGDIVVWSNKLGVAGHIAIALGGGTTSKFKCFEQNNPLGTNAHISDRTYTNVLGWLRPKVQEAGETEPHWFKTLLQESVLSLDNEGEFRAFWDKAKRYDDEVNSLKEQIKSVNEALADRALEVSILTEKNQKLSDSQTEAQEQLNKIRSERDQATWQVTQLEIKIKSLDEEIIRQLAEIDKLHKTLGFRVLIDLGSLVVAKRL